MRSTRYVLWLSFRRFDLKKWVFFFAGFRRHEFLFSQVRGGTIFCFFVNQCFRLLICSLICSLSLSLKKSTLFIPGSCILWMFWISSGFDRSWRVQRCPRGWDNSGPAKIVQIKLHALDQSSDSKIIIFVIKIFIIVEIFIIVTIYTLHRLLIR